VRPSSQFLHSYIWEGFIFSHNLVLFGISIFLYFMRELLAQPQERGEGQGTATKQWLAPVPCPPLLRSSWAKSPINDQQTNLLATINPCSQFLIWLESEWDSKLDIYIGFSPTIHLQGRTSFAHSGRVQSDVRRPSARSPPDLRTMLPSPMWNPVVIFFWVHCQI
jgi:hypothetical protein